MEGSDSQTVCKNTIVEDTTNKTMLKDNFEQLEEEKENVHPKYLGSRMEKENEEGLLNLTPREVIGVTKGDDLPLSTQCFPVHFKKPIRRKLSKGQDIIAQVSSTTMCALEEDHPSWRGKPSTATLIDSPQTHVDGRATHNSGGSSQSVRKVLSVVPEKRSRKSREGRGGSNTRRISYPDKSLDNGSSSNCSPLVPSSAQSTLSPPLQGTKCSTLMYDPLQQQTDLPIYEKQNLIRHTELAQECLNATAKIEKISKTIEDLRQFAAQTNAVDKSQTTKLISVMKNLLKEKTQQEKKFARLKCNGNKLRLGEYEVYNVGARIQRKWINGLAFQDIFRRKEKLLSEWKVISIEKETLMKYLADATGDEGGERSSAVLKATDPFSKLEPFSLLAGEEYHKKYKILELRRNVLQKQVIDIRYELKKLNRETRLHLGEIERIANEDASIFNNHPTIKERYLLLTLLGKGGFSEVYKAFDLKEHRLVACKIHKINKKDEFKSNYVKHALREYNILKTLHHPNIVKLYDASLSNGNNSCIFLELCSELNLKCILERDDTIVEREAKCIIIQVMSALKYLNEIKPRVIHYDLKPANILLTEGNVNGKIKITDFGLSKFMGEDNYSPENEIYLTSQGSGTYWYLPPECFFSGKKPPKISSKVDVWSTGVLFFECLFGRRPFGHNDSQRTILEENIILRALHIKYPDSPAVSDEAKTFIGDCLTYSKEDRMDVLSLTKHEYLNP